MSMAEDDPSDKCWKVQSDNAAEQPGYETIYPLCDHCHQRSSVAVAIIGYQFVRYNDDGKLDESTAQFRGESGHGEGYHLCEKCLEEFKRSV